MRSLCCPPARLRIGPSDACLRPTQNVPEPIAYNFQPSPGEGRREAPPKAPGTAKPLPQSSVAMIGGYTCTPGDSGPRRSPANHPPHVVARVPQVRHGRWLRGQGGDGGRGALRCSELLHRLGGQHPLLRQRQPGGAAERHR